MSVQQSEEERQPKKGGAEAALAAYLLGAATVGIALLARTLQKKLRRRRRVVRARSNAFVACCAQTLYALPLICLGCARSVIGELDGLLRRPLPLPTAAATCPCTPFLPRLACCRHATSRPASLASRWCPFWASP